MRRAVLNAQQDIGTRRLAETVCMGLPSKAFVDEYLALYRFVLSRCRYMRDPRTVELVRAPPIVARALFRGETPSMDCDDMAALLGAMVLAVGGRCRFATVAFRTITYQGELQYTHVFCQAQEPSSRAWITLDPVAADKTRSMMRKIKHAKFWLVA